MMKACLIGVSGFGETHYNDLMREIAKGRAKLLGATIINQDDEPEKCARLREIGCELYTDYREMLKAHGGECDVCWIPTGIHLHKMMTVDALKAGMNVMVEKPVAATIDEVNEMKQAQEETGKWVAVGYQSMYAPDIHLMKQTIVDGRVGDIKSIKCYGLWPRHDSYYARNNWAGKLKIGDAWVLDSPFNNALAHYLNLVCFLGGETFERPAELASIQAELYRVNDIESPDTAAMRMISKTGLPMYFYVTHAPEKSYGPVIQITGTKGCIHWSFHKNGRIVFSDGSEETLPDVGHDELRIHLFNGLFEKLSNPAGFICNLEIAGTQTLCVNGAHQSCPVRKLDAKYFKTVTEDNGSTRKVIPGLDALTKQAYEEEKLFSEVGAPWAEKSPVFDLTGYRSFAGLA